MNEYADPQEMQNIGLRAQLKPKLRITYKRGRWYCGYPGMSHLWLASGSSPKEAYVLWGQSQFWKGRA